MIYDDEINVEIFRGYEFNLEVCRFVLALV